MNKLTKIFVGGLPRSGTTMVQNILDSHPLIYGGPEFDRIPNIMDLRNKLQSSLKAGRILAYTTKAEIDDAVADLITALITPLNIESTTTHICEKTPWNILFFDELLEVFPKAKFIMVLRNPIDVFNSMKVVAKKAKEKQIDAPDFTKNYKIAVAYMEQVYKIMFRLLNEQPDRVYLIRYEDLVKNLEKETHALCSFLQVEWSETLLAFNTIKHPGEQTMTQNEIWYTKTSFNANPNEVINNSKENLLTRLETAFITYMFRKNEFVNKGGCYLEEPNNLNRLLGKWVFQDFKKNYRFKELPKRVLGE